MKQSKRLLVGTMVVLYAALALQTGISRALLDEAARDPRLPQRITAEQLATLRDFEQIRVEGDFSVEVIQQADYAIELLTTPDATTPKATTHGRPFYVAAIDELLHRTDYLTAHLEGRKP